MFGDNQTSKNGVSDKLDILGDVSNNWTLK